MGMTRIESGLLPVIALNNGDPHVDTVVIGVVPGKQDTATFALERVDLASTAGVTGSDLGTATIRYVRGGVDQGAVAALLFATGVDIAAMGTREIPRTAAPLLIPGDVLVMDWTQTGLGVALAAGSRVTVEIGG
jgi:hypothetical protein